MKTLKQKLLTTTVAVCALGFMGAEASAHSGHHYRDHGHHHHQGSNAYCSERHYDDDYRNPRYDRDRDYDRRDDRYTVEGFGQAGTSRGDTRKACRLATSRAAADARGECYRGRIYNTSITSRRVRRSGGSHSSHICEVSVRATCRSY